MSIDLEALLQNIPGENPGGADVRYHLLTDQIKEARRQEDKLNQGIWQRDVKTADYPAVIKLCKETLTKHSKDLQIAAWLLEALLHTDQLAGLAQGLELISRLLENFWDSLYPQIDEDGDLEFRATPLRWIGSQLDIGIRSVALTEGGHNWYQYRESRSVPSEDDARMDMSKQGRREEALAEGLVTPEEFERGFETTSVVFSQNLYERLAQLVQTVRNLGGFCDEKFGDASPDFTPLRTSLEEVQQTARVLLTKKGGPQAAQNDASEEVSSNLEQLPASQGSERQNETVFAAAPPVRRTQAGTEPASPDEAIERLLATARYLRRELPFSPVPYLIPRALRFGELRATGGTPDPMFLTAPPGEIRAELKRLALESSWDQLREKAEEAVGMPCGRAWLDVQRYSWTACYFSGAQLPAQAIVSELRCLVADFPQIAQWMLADDTPTANTETLQWMQQNGVFPSPPVEEATAPPEPASPIAVQWYPPAPPEMNEHQPALPDAFDLAMDSARSGRVGEALEMLTHEIARESSGRGKFLRRVQLAQVCLSTGNDEIGRPILQELAEEIDRRGLDAWEGSELIAPPLTLLYRCYSANGSENTDDRHKLYARICRLDPARALALPR